MQVIRSSLDQPSNLLKNIQHSVIYRITGGEPNHTKLELSRNTKFMNINLKLQGKIRWCSEVWRIFVLPKATTHRNLTCSYFVNSQNIFVNTYALKLGTYIPHEYIELSSKPQGHIFIYGEMWSIWVRNYGSNIYSFDTLETYLSSYPVWNHTSGLYVIFLPDLWYTPFDLVCMLYLETQFLYLFPYGTIIIIHRIISSNHICDLHFHFIYLILETLCGCKPL